MIANRYALAFSLLAMMAALSCSRYPRTQTVLHIRTTESIARMTQSLLVVVRDSSSAEVLNVPIATQRNFLERTVDFPGYPVRIPISSSNRSVIQQPFDVCVRGVGFAGAETAAQCVQSGFVLGKALALDLWLLPAGSCSTCPAGTGCMPVASAFACVSTMPGDLAEYGTNSDAGVALDATAVDAATADAAAVDTRAEVRVSDIRVADVQTGS